MFWNLALSVIGSWGDFLSGKMEEVQREELMFYEERRMELPERLRGGVKGPSRHGHDRGLGGIAVREVLVQES